MIDDEDYDVVSQFKWSVSKAGKKYYAKASVPQSQLKSEGRKGCSIHLHALIMRFPSKLVDHINGDTLDCRKENLREATSSQNSANRNGIHAKNTSGYRGVSFDKINHKWRAKVQVGLKHKTVGRFARIQDAINAAKEARLKYFGEFAGA